MCFLWRSPNRHPVLSRLTCRVHRWLWHCYCPLCKSKYGPEVVGELAQGCARRYGSLGIIIRRYNNPDCIFAFTKSERKHWRGACRCTSGETVCNFLLKCISMLGGSPIASKYYANAFNSSESADRIHTYICMSIKISVFKFKRLQYFSKFITIC